MSTRISISQLQDNVGKFIHDCRSEPIEVTRHGKTMAYIIPTAMMNISQSYSMSDAGSASLSIDSVQNISVPKEDHEETHTHE